MEIEKLLEENIQLREKLIQAEEVLPEYFKKKNKLEIYQEGKNYSIILNDKRVFGVKLLRYENCLFRSENLKTSRILEALKFETKPSSPELIEDERKEKLILLVESYKVSARHSNILVGELLDFIKEEKTSIIDKCIEICNNNNPEVNVADLVEFQDGARSVIKNIIQDLAMLK